MADTVTVADAAYPFDYTILPADVSRILGYEGMTGYTPHVWTLAEIDKARAAGLEWHPIVTVPIRALTGADGQAAASAMITRLHVIGYPPGWPVFLDIEHGAYAADPPGAEACVAAWQTVMAGAGWPGAYPYLPLAADHGWVADWTGTPHVPLPDAWVGHQYTGGQDHDRYDLSVMRAELFTNAEGLTVADIQAIIDRISSAQSAIVKEVRIARGDVTSLLDADVARLAAAITATLPAGQTLTVADVETAIRTVLVSGVG